MYRRKNTDLLRLGAAAPARGTAHAEEIAEQVLPAAVTSLATERGVALLLRHSQDAVSAEAALQMRDAF
jgi:hypothetical protein